MYDDCRHALKSTLRTVWPSHGKPLDKRHQKTTTPSSSTTEHLLVEHPKTHMVSWKKALVGRFDKPNISFGRIFLLKAILVLGVPKWRETQFTCKIRQRKHEWPWPHGDNFRFTDTSNELEKGDPFRVGMKAETSLGQTSSLRYKKCHYPLIMGCKKDFKNY